MWYSTFIVVLQSLGLFLTATCVFDLVHFLLHVGMKSKNALFRTIGSIHFAHHRFFSNQLQIKTEYTKQNFIYQVALENLVQLSVILCGLLVVSRTAVLIALCFQLLVLIIVCALKGIDPHHQSYTQLPAYRGWFVSAPYHALHHRYASNYYGSYLKLIDIILGTGHVLENKHIVMTGASGALGSQMKKYLEKEGAVVTCFKFNEDYTYANYDKLIPALSQADILCLCHGSKVEKAQEANCDSYVALIELYKKVKPVGLMPPEVWATGSEIECHPCFGLKNLKVYAASKRNFAKHAHQYFADTTIQYRHLVHSGFCSRMGTGLITAKFAAFMTVFLLKRGFRYVPVTYTGVAWVNYFRFVFKM